MRTPYPRRTGQSTKPNIPTDIEQRDGETEIQSNGESEIQRFKGNRDSKETQESEEKLRLFKRIHTVMEAAQAALADKGGGDPVFKFARAVKALEMTRDVRLTRKELGEAFAIWWPLAESKLKPGTDREGYRFLFLEAFRKAKLPLGANAIEFAMARVGQTTEPPEAEQYESKGIRRLVHLCCQLQLISGNEPFYLSLRDAAPVVGCDSLTTAGAYLKGLVEDGILESVEWGVPGGSRASRFKYCFSTKPTA